MTKTYYVSSLSGWQDSTAMTVKILEEWLPLDYIVFMDTWKEFPQMYEYVDKLEKYLMDKFNFTLTRLKWTSTFDDWCFWKYTRWKLEWKVRWIPRSSMLDWCTRDLKVYPSDRFCNKLDWEVMRYIWYTFTEKRRAVPKPDQIYPLIEWEMCEEKISAFLKERWIWNPVYKHFSRTWCFLCPKQRKKAFFQLYRYYPEQWLIMLDYEKKCKELDANQQTFYPTMTLIEMEEEFESRWCEQMELDFAAEEDPEVSCFCK